MNIHTMLKQKKKKAREAVVRAAAAAEAGGNQEQPRTYVVHNVCPRCGYNMGAYWSSQYCSRRCLYGYEYKEDVAD